MAKIENYTDAWEGHTHQEVEEVIKETLEDIYTSLGDTSVQRVTITPLGTSHSFMANATNVKFKFRVNSTTGGSYDDKFKDNVEIYVGNNEEIQVPSNEIERIFDGLVLDKDTEIETPNLASYLNAAIVDSSNRIVVTIRINYGSATAETKVRYTKQAFDFWYRTAFGSTYPTISSVDVEYDLGVGRGTMTVDIYNQGGTIKQHSYSSNVENIGVVSVPLSSSDYTISQGVHLVKAYLTLTDGTETDAKELSIISVAGYSNDTAFILFDSIPNVTQYSILPINYLVYMYYTDTTIEDEDREEREVWLQALVNGNWVTKLIHKVKVTTADTWNYLVPNAGENRVRIVIPNKNPDGTYSTDSFLAQTQLTFVAEASKVNWKIKEGSTVHLSALGRTNNDGNVSEWKDSGYSVEFEDMQWDSSGSGWEDGDNLHLIGKSRATIKNFYPFYSNITSTDNLGGGILRTGAALKISFKVSNVSNPNEKVISCIDKNNNGFYVTGESIYINIGKELTSDPTEQFTKSLHNSRKFSADSKIDLIITLEPYSYNNSGIITESTHRIAYYINGEIAGFNALINNNIAMKSWSQLVATPVTFGGDGASLHLYDVRYYNTYCTAFEALQLYAMDSNDATLLNDTYNKNKYYGLTESGPKLTFAQALEYGKYLATTGKTNFGVFVASNLCNSADYVGNTKEHHIAGVHDFFYIYRFTTNSKGEGIIDPNLTVFIESMEDVGDGDALRFRRQGTSTRNAVKGNIRIDVRGKCLLHHYNPTTASFYTEADEKEVNDGSRVETLKKKARCWQIPDADAIPCYLLTLKKNPNESTQARNLPTAKWYEDCCRYLATVNTGTSESPAYGYEDCLTPPQRRELAKIVEENPTLPRKEQVAKIKTRQCVDGIPSIGFEMPRITDAVKRANPLLLTSSDGEITFGGQYDMITDKTNMDVFGFGGDGTKDEDFSVEWRSNGSPICNFHTNNIRGGGQYLGTGSIGSDAIEYRYPIDSLSVCGDTVPSSIPNESDTPTNRGLTTTGPIQKLFDFICNCSPFTETVVNNDGSATGETRSMIGRNYHNGISESNDYKLTINGVSVDGGDTTSNRELKFIAELKNYVIVNQFLFNFIAIDRGLMCDQDVKNQFFTYMTGEEDFIDDTAQKDNKHLRLLGYDFDSSWSMDNDNYFKFPYTVRYTDGVYDGNDNYRIGNSWKSSDLWYLINKLFQKEIGVIAGYLYQGGLLTAEGILKYMHENQVDIYNAMQYNVNSEFSYTSGSDAEYAKAHGSAKEHNEWFVNGRMYFSSGNTFNLDDGSDFGKNFTQFGLTFLDENIDKYNYINRFGENNDRHYELNVTAYEKTYCYLRAGTTAAVTYQSVMNGLLDNDNKPIIDRSYNFIDVVDSYDENFNLVNREYKITKLTMKLDQTQSDYRAYIYGGKMIKSITGLERWYISDVVDWGELLNCEELILGSREPIVLSDETSGEYENKVLSSLGLKSNQRFGSCKKLSLAGCTGFTDELSLGAFPILEEFDGYNMKNLRKVSLPSGGAMKKLSLPANLTEITLSNKPNLETIEVQGTENITKLVANNVSQSAAAKMIDLIIENIA